MQESDLPINWYRLTRFERTKIIGTRATQLQAGSPPHLELSDEPNAGTVNAYIRLAEAELEAGKLAYIRVERTLPDGTRVQFAVGPGGRLTSGS